MTRPMDLAYKFIKDKILDGSFRPSQRLIELELSELIGASRNTIKKALLALEKENLVEIQKNKGAFVKSFTLEEIINYLEIREALEGLVARTAAKQIDKGALEKLKKVLDQMHVSLEEHRFDEYSVLNKQFHKIIYEASGNPQAVEIIEAIKTQLARYHFRTILIPGRNESSYEEHKQILSSLQAGDSAAAEKAVTHHISKVSNTIRDNFPLLT
ncbi:GntR family transcriptional regulator [Sporosarcina obsidiansis]|uniref:GntR family transcriptional regulator n=1 Tax=Sporosarcina obsidiansis TaxID=2660748 RepID=UPI00129ADE4A|nr:GntR family transcriptional regulator [Sporosarcina obsidiansis]